MSNVSIRLTVRLRHVGKTQSEALVIGASQRILSLQIDVVGYRDQSPLLVFDINSSGSISEYDSLNAHASENPHRERDLVRRVTFVKMHPPLHDRNRNISGETNDHLSGMSNGRRLRKARNTRVRDSRCFGELVSKAAKPGTQHKPNSRTQRSLRQQKVCRGFSAREIITVQHFGISNWQLALSNHPTGPNAKR